MNSGIGGRLLAWVEPPRLCRSPGQREALEVLARSGTTPFREVRRAQALLMAADGLPNVQIAAAVGVTPVTVRAWRTRFAEEGPVRFAQVREGRGRNDGGPGRVSRDTVHRMWRPAGCSRIGWRRANCRTIRGWPR